VCVPEIELASTRGRLVVSQQLPWLTWSGVAGALVGLILLAVILRQYG
jgi:hypothetical protein